MKHIHTFESFLNEASFAGRAWSGNLQNIDDLLSWMYDKGVLTKAEQAEKDKKFREYYRWYNDGDYPSGLKGMSDAKVEDYLEKSIEDFIKSVLSKYAGKYDRQSFHFDKLLSQYYTIQGNLKASPSAGGNKVFDYNISSFIYFYDKLGKVEPEFDKLVVDLKKQYEDFSKDADKAIEDYRKANPDIKSYEGPSTNKIFNAKIEDMKTAGILTPAIEKKAEVIRTTCDKLYDILGNVIEAANKAKTQLG
jgi:hypothetical protein